MVDAEVVTHNYLLESFYSQSYQSVLQCDLSLCPQENDQGYGSGVVGFCNNKMNFFV